MLHPNQVFSIEGSPAWLYIQGFQVRWHLKILKSLKKEVETLTQCSGGSLIHHPDTFFQGEISKQKSLKGLFVRNSLKTGGREGGRSISHDLKVLWVEMLLQLSCIPFHCADVNSCKRSPGRSSGFAVITDSRSYSGMPPAGIFPFIYPRDELLCGHIPSLEGKRQSWPFLSFSVNVLFVFLVKGCPEALWKVQLCKGALVMWDWEKGCRCQKKRWEWMWVKETRKK